MVKKTLQEIADFFDMAAAVDKNGDAALFSAVPERRDTWWMMGSQEDESLDLLPGMFDYSGDWRDSLALPDGWGDKPTVPFKEGELVVNIPSGDIYPWAAQYVPEIHRRPTEAEWAVLRGEG